MKKILYSFIITFILLFGYTNEANAVTLVAGTSAQIQAEVIEKVKDTRADRLRQYLEKYNSPLSAHSQSFIDEADRYDIPWTWLPAISGVESTFGKAIPTNSYNGWGWANGAYSFTSWEDAISIITKALRENYVNRGADTIEKIGPVYAPPSTTWVGKVLYFIDKIEEFKGNEISSLPISI